MKFDMPALFRRSACRKLLALLPGLVLLCACNAAQTEPAKQTNGEQHLLTIYGYNYTNRYIDQFYVDGQGGGNLDPSTPTAGGGKGVCCIGWNDSTSFPQTVQVRWVASACMQKVTNSSGESREVPVHSFKELAVELRGPVPQDPKYFEVHIYPDDRVEVAITSKSSEPRLKLDASRVESEDIQYPQCRQALPAKR